MPKRLLRTYILERRQAMPDDLCFDLSAKIQQRLLAHPLLQFAKTVALYSAVRQEVLTDLLRDHCLEAGKRVAYPFTASDGKVGFRIISSTDDLARGRFNIPEPRQGCEPLMPEDADLIVIPGVAFDLCGRRLGYGKGCYDRTLHALEGQGRLVALAYSFQVVERLPSEPHDVVMDFVVTEDAVTPTNLNRR